MHTITLDDCWNRIGIQGDKSCEKLSRHIHCHHCDVFSNAANAIMERAIPTETRREWTRHYAEKPPEKRAQDEAAMVFRVGAEWLALPMRLALTVAAVSPIHRVPHRPAPALLGIVNVRGIMYPCMSLAALLGIPGVAVGHAGRHSRAFARHLVMTLGGQDYVLPVEEVLGIHRYAAEELGPAPTTAAATTAAGTEAYLLGVLNADGIRIGCLDARRLGDSFAGMLK